MNAKNILVAVLFIFGSAFSFYSTATAAVLNPDLGAAPSGVVRAAISDSPDFERDRNGLVDTVVRRYRHHVAFRALSALDDRLLRDVGLSRQDMAGVTASPFRSRSIPH